MFHWGAISWGILLVTLGFGGVILAKKCLMGYIGIRPKMAVMGHDYIYFLLLDAFVGYILTYFIVRDPKGWSCTNSS